MMKVARIVVSRDCTLEGVYLENCLELSVICQLL